VPVSCDVSWERQYSGVVTDGGTFLVLQDAAWLNAQTFPSEVYSSGGTIDSQTYSDSFRFISETAFLVSFVQKENLVGAFEADVLVLLRGTVGSATVTENNRVFCTFPGSSIQIESSAIYARDLGTTYAYYYFIMVKKDADTHHLYFLESTSLSFSITYNDSYEITPNILTFHDMSILDLGAKFAFSFCVKDND